MRANEPARRTVYPMVETGARPLPPRSRLYRLEPMGIGTPFTESLTSYVCRLAKAHHVTMNSLFEFILRPALGNKYLPNSDIYSPGVGLSKMFGYRTKCVNGVSQIAFDWVHMVESLTTRRDLRFLTLLTLSDVMHSRYLIRKFQAWCPECYEESRLNNQTIYTPLIWFINAVEMCPRHLRRLIDKCPGCGKQMLPLARRAFPGYCSRCTVWLGTKHKGVSDLMPESQMEWHASVSSNVGELIASAPSFERPLARDGVGRMLRACVDQVADGMMTKLVKVLGKPKTSIWGWYHGRIRPNLYEMLKICYCIDISLVDLISGAEKQLSDLHIVRSFTDTYISRPPRTVRQIDYHKVEVKLRDILRKDIPISVTQAGEAVGVNRRTLYYKFPEICYAISKRYAEYRRAEVEKQRQQFEDEVTEACVQLKAQRVYPSNRKIAKFLGKPTYLNRRGVTAIARAFRQ
jgi:hypothetical protein